MTNSEVESTIARPSELSIVSVTAWWNSKTPFAALRTIWNGRWSSIIANEFERRFGRLRLTLRPLAVRFRMREPSLTKRGHYAKAHNAKSLRRDKMASVSERERTIGQRERAFDLQKQICVEITRGLAHLNRQWKLSSQKFEIGKQISAAEIRLNDARERFENCRS